MQPQQSCWKLLSPSLWHYNAVASPRCSKRCTLLACVLCGPPQQLQCPTLSKSCKNRHTPDRDSKCILTKPILTGNRMCLGRARQKIWQQCNFTYRSSKFQIQIFNCIWNNFYYCKRPECVKHNFQHFATLALKFSASCAENIFHCSSCSTECFFFPIHTVLVAT